MPIVLATVCVSLATAWLVVHGDTAAAQDGLWLAVALAALGIGAEVIAFQASKQTLGSVALIPFSAALLVAPHSLTILTICLGELGLQLFTRRPALKALFNLAQYSLGLAVGLLAFRAVGGTAFLPASEGTFADALAARLPSAAALVFASFMANTATVSVVLAATMRRPFTQVFWSNTRATAPFIVLLLLVSFYLTWLSVNLGLIGTIGMVIPMFAVRQLYRTATELTNVTEELLDLMVAAIEARDPYTSGHSKRVARASEVIARAIGLSPQQVERVTVAALLHDVGKIDEAFARILAKEGRLSPEEWEVMKRHPVRSAELVGMLSSLKDIVAPVRHHHENWDGTGYPDGLSGEQIPLASRIIMFADTLDAITTDRPYRKALGLEAARAEFVKFRGRQFDPVICDQVVSREVWTLLYESFVARTEGVAAKAS